MCVMTPDESGRIVDPKVSSALHDVDRYMGPALQRARDLADKIHRAAKLCREVDEDGEELPDPGIAIDAEEYRREER